MKAFRLLVTLLLVALCTGQTSCSSKVFTPDVNVKEVNSKQYIYYQDEPFNGTVFCIVLMRVATWLLKMEHQ